MSRPIRRPIAVATVAAVAGLAAVALGTAVPAAGAAADPPAGVLTGSCLNPTVRLSVEEGRLASFLPRNGDPTRLQSQPFAQQLIDGAGPAFTQFAPQLVSDLCTAKSLTVVRKLAAQRGEQLWTMAVDRAQRRSPAEGSLPYSDDRPLYWVRMQAEAAIAQWMPSFVLSDAKRNALLTTFDKAAHGMNDINFPAGKQTKRLIMSGFDPYTLDGGPQGTAPGAVGNNIRHGNPSGALALAVDGTKFTAADGKVVHIEAYTLPVDFPQFEQGYLEDTVGPYMKAGPKAVDASVTVSQAGPYEFDLEQWNARYHGTSLGNDNFEPCPSIGGVPQLAINNPECNSMVVPQWGGPAKFNLRNPAQFTTTSLPVAKMIAAKTGSDVPRPPGDGWADKKVAFGTVWHTNYTEFPDCASTERVTRNSPVPTEYPPPSAPIAPDPKACSYSGGGGNYLSNESAYRNTLLRDRLGRDIPAGHIHTPNMQHFGTKDLYNPSDNTFNLWRLAIVDQAKELVDVVAYTAP